VSLDVVALSGSGRAVAANQKIRLRLVSTGTQPVLLAYGTATYAMTLTLPYKSGLG
jgi:hypothetical protein